jgi:hypothetical protein
VLSSLLLNLIRISAVIFLRNFITLSIIAAQSSAGISSGKIFGGTGRFTMV